MRAEIEAQRATEAANIPLGVNYAAVERITLDHARQLVEQRRTEVALGMGCWVDTNAPTHANGYKSINLANTHSRVEGHTDKKIGLQKMYMHHLALVGAGRRAELSRCTQANSIFQVSHLCHNGGCYNPDHLVVEESWRNKDRNSCQGHERIDYTGLGQMRYHPCSHGGEHNEYRRCVLPVRHITEPGIYGNTA